MRFLRRKETGLPMPSCAGGPYRISSSPSLLHLLTCFTAISANFLMPRHMSGRTLYRGSHSICSAHNALRHFKPRGRLLLARDVREEWDSTQVRLLLPLSTQMVFPSGKGIWVEMH